MEEAKPPAQCTYCLQARPDLKRIKFTRGVFRGEHRMCKKCRLWTQGLWEYVKDKGCQQETSAPTACNSEQSAL